MRIDESTVTWSAVLLVDQSPSTVVVRYSHHTPLQPSKLQESYQTDEIVFITV